MCVGKPSLRNVCFYFATELVLYLLVLLNHLWQHWALRANLLHQKERQTNAQLNDLVNSQVKLLSQRSASVLALTVCYSFVPANQKQILWYIWQNLIFPKYWCCFKISGWILSSTVVRSPSSKVKYIYNRLSENMGILVKHIQNPLTF